MDKKDKDIVRCEITDDVLAKLPNFKKEIIKNVCNEIFIKSNTPPTPTSNNSSKQIVEQSNTQREKDLEFDSFFLSSFQKIDLIKNIVSIIKSKIGLDSNNFNDFYYFVHEKNLNVENIIKSMLDDNTLNKLIRESNNNEYKSSSNQIRRIIEIISYALLKYPHYDALKRKLPDVLGTSIKVVRESIKKYIPLLSNVNNNIDIKYLLPHESNVSYFDFYQQKDHLIIKKFDPDSRFLISGYIYYYFTQLNSILFDVKSNESICTFNRKNYEIGDLGDYFSDILINTLINKDERNISFISKIPFNILFILRDFLDDYAYLSAFKRYFRDLSKIILKLIYYNAKFNEFNTPLNVIDFLRDIKKEGVNSVDHHKVIEDIIDFLSKNFTDFILIKKGKEKLYDGYDGIYIKNFRDKFRILLELYRDINNIKCNKCGIGFVFMSIFQFHHFDSKLKRFVFANIKSLSYDKLLDKVKTESLVPLCVNCHLEESALYFNYFKDLILKVNLFNYESDQILEFISDAINNHPETKDKGSYKNEIKSQLIDWINKRYLIEQLQNGICIGCRKTFVDKLYAFHIHHRRHDSFDILSRWVDLCKLRSVIEISKTMKNEGSCFLCGNCHFFITYYSYIKYSKDIIGKTYSTTVEEHYNNIINNINNYQPVVLSKDPFDVYNFQNSDFNERYLVCLYLYVECRGINEFITNDLANFFGISQNRSYGVYNSLLDLGYINIKFQPSATNVPRIFMITTQGFEKAKNIVNNMSNDYINKIKSSILVKLRS